MASNELDQEWIDAQAEKYDFKTKRVPLPRPKPRDLEPGGELDRAELENLYRYGRGHAEGDVMPSKRPGSMRPGQLQEMYKSIKPHVLPEEHQYMEDYDELMKAIRDEQGQET